jgi:hypothetical protein
MPPGLSFMPSVISTTELTLLLSQPACTVW